MRKLLWVLCLSAGSFLAQQANAQQGLNNLWLVGYNSVDGLPYGNTNVEFISGAAELSLQAYQIGFSTTAANITRGDGGLEFSTNGAFLADRNGDTLSNGSGLAPSSYTTQHADGLSLPRGALIIPVPNAPDSYYLFHGTVDDQSDYTADYLYLTTVDMGLNNSQGEVVLKNHVLFTSIQQYGKITGVRHANGRDWWVFNHQANNNVFDRFLVTPSGVELDGTQSIGISRPPDGGNVCFSPDGSKFAYYWGESDLEVYSFDRCSGLFSDPVFIPIDDSNGGGGVAFSPNSQYLYVSSTLDLYQYDTEASDVAGSMIHVGIWDGFYSPEPPLATLFFDAQLAPDGKIYISTGNSTFHLHVINAPDEAGFACDLVQHGVELPAYYFNGLPNHPNYHLGPVDGSVCDSLGINVGMAFLGQDAGPGVSAAPNPSAGAFTLTYPAQATAGLLEVLDVQGRVVYRQRLAAWSQVHSVALEQVQAGLYHCRLQWGAHGTTVRVIVREPCASACFSCCSLPCRSSHGHRSLPRLPHGQRPTRLPCNCSCNNGLRISRPSNGSAWC